MKRVIGLLLLCCSTLVCHAGDKHWANPVNGNFNDASKWTPNGVPNINDDVHISTNGSFTVTIDAGSFACRNLLIGGGIGEQRLIVTNSSYVLSTNNTVITTNGVLITNNSSMEGGGIYNSGTLTISNTTIAANTANHEGGGIFVSNTTPGNGGILIGTVTNSTSAEITISNSGGHPSSLVFSGGVFNDGLITVTSSVLSSNSTTALIVQNGFTNTTTGVVVFSPDANNDGVLDIGPTGVFSNLGGHLIFTSTTSIIQRNDLLNHGIVEVHNGNVDVIQGIGREFDHHGSLFVATTASLSLLAGDFYSRPGSELSGGGIYNFEALSIGNGPMLCTTATIHFRGVSILNSTLLSNSGTVVFSGSNTVEGPIENQSGGSLFIQSSTSFPFSSVQSGGGIYNGGSLFVTSASTTSFSSVQLQCSGGPLINDGNIFISRNQLAPPTSFSFQDINADGIRVVNNGGITVLPGGNSFFTLASSPFDGSGGGIFVQNGGVLGLSSQTSFTSSQPLAPITTATISIQPAGRLDVFSHEPGALFRMNSFTTATLSINGTMICDVPQFDPTDAPPLSGGGNLFVRNSTILGPLTPEAGPGITIQNCILSTSASLLFNGASNSILDRNTFHGPTVIATNCTVFVNNDPLGNRGADNVSDNQFFNSFTNNGNLLFNRNTEPVSLSISSTSAVFLNNGTLKLHSPVPSRFFAFTNATVHNRGVLIQTVTSASFSLHMHHSSLINDGGIFLTSATVMRDPLRGSGVFLSNSSFVSSTSARLYLAPGISSSLLRVTSSSIVNNGKFFLFPNTSPEPHVSLLNGSTFINGGRIVSTTLSLQVTGSSLVVNGGQLHVSTTASLLLFPDRPAIDLRGGGIFENTTGGSVLIQRFATTATLLFGTSSSFRNNGVFEGDRFDASPGNSSLPGIDMRPGGSFVTSTSSSFRFRNYSTTAVVFLGSSSRFTNQGTVQFERNTAGATLVPGNSLLRVTGSSLFVNATNSTLRLFDYSPPSFAPGVLRLENDARLENGGLLLGRALLTTATSSFHLSEGSIILRNNSTLINGTTGTFRFRNFATTAVIFLGDASRWSNQGETDLRSDWTPSTGANIRITEPRIKLFGSSEFENSGTFRFRNFATTATIFLGDASRWNNSGTSIGEARTNSSDTPVGNHTLSGIEVRNSSAVDNSGTIRFRNFATTATIFLGDASRWNNSGTTDLFRQPQPGSGYLPFPSGTFSSTCIVTNTTNALFRMRCWTPPTIHTPALKLEGESCVENSGRLELDTRFGVPTNATIVGPQSGQLLMTGNVKLDNKQHGRVTFRNFTTTATIFIDGNSRLTNNGTCQVFKHPTTAVLSLPDHMRDVRLGDNGVIVNATNAIFRHSSRFAGGTLWIDDSTRIENHGVFLVDRAPTTATAPSPPRGSLLLGTGNSMFRNQDSGRITFTNRGTSASVTLRDDCRFLSRNRVGYVRRTVNTTTNLLRIPFQALELEDNAQVTIATTGGMFFEGFEQPVLISPNGTSSLLFLGDLEFNSVFSTSQIVALGNSHVTLSNNLFVSSASLCVQQTTNSTVHLSTSLNITLNSGAFQYKGTPLVFSTSSSFSGSGTFSLGTSATILGSILPGSSPGQLIFNSDIVLGSDSHIELEIEGQTPGLEHDNIIVNGHLERNGSVTVQNINGYIPPDFTIYELIQHQSVSGDWSWNGLSYPGGSYEVTTTAGLTYVTSHTSSASVLVTVQAYLGGFWDGASGRITPVVIESRTGATLAGSSLVERQTAIMSTTGTASALFNATSGYNWLVLRHAGSLDIGSATPISFDAPVQADFTNPINVANGANALVEKTIGGVTVFVLLNGDLNGDNATNATDFLQLFLPNFSKVNPGGVPD